MFRSVLALSLALVLSMPGISQEPKDPRSGSPKNYNSYFPWTPPTDKDAWTKRRQELKEQVLVSQGLWPMPEKQPIKAVSHGKIERDGYTVEKVFFASHPGHYVTGNLYRPTGKTGKLPGILCPHGHWGNRSDPSTNGRFYDAGEKGAEAQIKQGAEKTMESARYPLQARAAGLARLGCVVFFYDMVGYGDSTQILHPGSKEDPRGSFSDPEAELRLQSFMGLQSWNSIRAVDFLLTLPEVDPSRIGVTGASGGGTQSFLLSALDDRVAVSVPAVMVSTAMQGGCTCENNSYLRVGTGNIELAGLTAPRPLGLIGADDWTIEIESKGLPELRQLYSLLGVPGNVDGKCFSQFKHNYNQVSREWMYNFFNKHFHLGHSEPITEKPFVPVPPRELSVFDKEHPLPKDAVNAEGLRRYLTREGEREVLSHFKEPGALRKMLFPALRTMASGSLPDQNRVVLREISAAFGEGSSSFSGVLVREGDGTRLPIDVVPGTGEVTVIWVHPRGTASLYEGNNFAPAVRELARKRASIIALDALGTGKRSKSARFAINDRFAGYTFGYNAPLVAERVQDILTAVAYAKSSKKGKNIHLVGFGEAGPWVALARGLCGDTVARTAVDMNNFRFEQILSIQDPMMLPGALKYGGLPTLMTLAAPHELLVHNTRGAGPATPLETAYRVAGQPGNLHRHEEALSAEKVIGWLLR